MKENEMRHCYWALGRPDMLVEAGYSAWFRPKAWPVALIDRHDLSLVLTCHTFTRPMAVPGGLVGFQAMHTRMH